VRADRTRDARGDREVHGGSGSASPGWRQGCDAGRVVPARSTLSPHMRIARSAACPDWCR
jgi:hypothetical protein